MSTATLTAESVVDLPPHEAFSLFGSAEGSNWLFDARCDSVAVGAPVRMTLPIDADPDRRRVELLGTMSAVRPGRAIVIDHVQPWPGRIRLSFVPQAPGVTRVRVRAEVSESGVGWLVRHRGIILPFPDAGEQTLRLGLVTSKSGPAAVYSMATEYLARLAVEEVNEGGGVRGRMLDLVVADDETDPEIAAIEAGRLRRAGCHAVFASTTSQSFAAIDAAVGRDVLVVHSVMNERGNSRRGAAVQLGERPDAQIAVIADRLMTTTGARDWFLVGERYSWSYGAHRAARIAVPRVNGRLVGQSYTSVGTTDFSPVIEQIQRSGADVVMSSLIGADEVEFERQCARAGLRDTTRTLSLVMDEPTREHIGASAAEGIWTAMAYFQDVAAEGNDRLLARYRERFGQWAPPVSTISETAYEAILQYAEAARRRGNDGDPLSARALVEHLEGVDGGAIGTRNLLAPALHLARVGADGVSVFEEAGSGTSARNTSMCR
ncbi:putative nitrile hydratase regulator clustered with urea transport [Pseudonocardia sp. Ae168_Ps1]|uniref:ABC transporter substrate-binding protein n=1 Tax=unclassified Pseudonocardia TaxID=2619320 RepID=UPI00094B0D31|nr:MULTISPECIES: ABC transporter substrate-binding protein [unclassified Pseudonocardia]OLL78003.1 putative nitrile hydratase regulator clustered with urea transport [Pseudonocardia sp. Ae168_Ps1]OLL92102.1 putative nitrile hydratase regulator clustered with urea transport [Pseudonocardia sp. Ae356_Ps1]